MKIGKDVKKEKDEILFLISYGIMIFINILRLSFYGKYMNDTVYGFLWIFAFVLLLIKELDSYISIKELLIGIILLFFFVCLKRGNYIGISLESVFCLLIFSSRNIDNNKIIRFLKAINIISLSIIVISSQIGIIPDICLNDGFRYRHFLGFRYALYPSCIMLHITYLYFISSKNKIIDVWKYVVLLLANYYFYHMTASRLSFGIGCMICLTGLFMLRLPNAIHKKSLLSKVCVVAVLFATGLSLYASYHYDAENPFYVKADSLLNTRLSLSKRSLDKYGIALFKRDITWNGQGVDYDGNSYVSGSDYDYVDNAYIRDLQRYGLIFYISACIALIYALNMVRRRGNIRLLLAFAFLLLQCMIDDLSLQVEFNSLWLILGSEVFKYLINEKGTIDAEETE